MSNKATEEVMDMCSRVINSLEKRVELFLSGTSKEKFGAVQISKDIAAEENINFSLVAPLVSAYVKKDPRIDSRKGKYNGGFYATGKTWEENGNV